MLRGFTFGIDFEGGTKVSMPAAAQRHRHTQQVEDVFSKALGKDAESVVVVGSGGSATVQIRSETLTNQETEQLRTALFDAFQPKGADGQPSKQAISDSAVSETWGGQITKKALLALVVFLVLAAIYIAIRYERYMAFSAMATLVFDLVVTAGVYSLVGFEVTPATVIGLLTILGFSLYDTVIVFDKVEENTHGFQHTTRRTFAEQANLAINQTFMRSINTSLISVLPIISLMVVAVWLLGVGTLKDLALVQLVGVIVGTYSSIFFATPLLVTLRERTELVRTHTRRVLRRRKSVGEHSRAPRRPTDDEPDAEREAVGAARGSGCQAGGRRTSPLRARGRSDRPAARPDGPRVSGTPGGGRPDDGPLAGDRRRGDSRARLCRTALSSCSGSPAGEINYAVDGTLTTYNTNTVAGAASGGPQAFARVLTGFNYHGPDGQIVGDHDFGTISVVGRAPLVLDYVINDKAVYSDGKPITCDDLVLAWAAQSGRFPGFDAANRAGYREIATVDCAPGQKRARVSFAAGPRIRRLRPVVRRHVADAVTRHLRRARHRRRRRRITQQRRPEHRPHRAGVEQHLEPDTRPRPEAVPVVGALQAGLGQRRRRGRARRERQVVGGQARHQQDHRLAPRRRRAGPPQQRLRRRRRRRHRLIGRAEHARRLRRGPTRPSAGIEQLIFSAQGPMAAPPARRALALCTPRD